MIEEPGEVFETEDPSSPSFERKIMKKIELVFPPPSRGHGFLESPMFLIGGVPFSFRIRNVVMYDSDDMEDMDQNEALHLRLSVTHHTSYQQRISVTLKKFLGLRAEDAIIHPYQEKSLGSLNLSGKGNGKRKLELTVTLHTAKKKEWTR